MPSEILKTNKDIDILHVINSPWDAYRRADCKVEYVFEHGIQKGIYDRHKLHIQIPSTHDDYAHFSSVENEIKKILLDAVENKVIRGFKVFDFEFPEDPEWDDLRQMQLPFVIYLFNEFDADNVAAVIAMLKKIEAVMKNVPRSDKDYFSKADIAFSCFTFRQTAIKVGPPYEYIPENDKRASILRELALQSDYLKAITTGLGINLTANVTKDKTTPAQPLTATAPQAQDDEKQKSINPHAHFQPAKPANTAPPKPEAAIPVPPGYKIVKRN